MCNSELEFAPDSSKFLPIVNKISNLPSRQNVSKTHKRKPRL